MSGVARKLVVEHRAIAEAREAFLWYLARNPPVAERFETAVESRMSAILERPDAFPEVEPGLRRCLVLDRFPYALLYRVTADVVLVVAVMHLRRRPGYR